MNRWIKIHSFLFLCSRIPLLENKMEDLDSLCLVIMAVDFDDSTRCGDTWWMNRIIRYFSHVYHCLMVKVPEFQLWRRALRIPQLMNTGLQYTYNTIHAPIYPFNLVVACDYLCWGPMELRTHPRKYLPNEMWKRWAHIKKITPHVVWLYFLVTWPSHSNYYF